MLISLHDAVNFLIALVLRIFLDIFLFIRIFICNFAAEITFNKKMSMNMVYTTSEMTTMLARGTYAGFILLLLIYFVFLKKEEYSFHRSFALCLFSLLVSVNSGTVLVVMQLKTEQWQTLYGLLQQMIVPVFGLLVFCIVRQPQKLKSVIGLFLLSEIPYLLAIFVAEIEEAYYIDEVMLGYSFIYAAVVVILAFKYIREYHKRLTNSYASTVNRRLDWAQRFIYVLIAYLVFYTSLSFILGGVLNGLFSDLYLLITATIIFNLSINLDVQKPVDVLMLDETAEEPESMQDDERIALLLKNNFESVSGFVKPDVTIRNVAQTVGLTVAQLSAYLNSKLGKNFNEYINSLRIEYACELLADKSIDMETVMVKSGYTSPSTFHRVFKLNTGVSPMEYREGLKGASLRARNSNLVRRNHEGIAKRVSLDSLTAKERELVRLIIKGNSTEQICKIMGVTEPSLRVFRSRLRAKLDLDRSDNLADVLKASVASASAT